MMRLTSALSQWAPDAVAGLLARSTAGDVRRALGAERVDIAGFLALLSRPAADFLEEMAQKAHRLTVQQFGRVMQLYIPLYLSNYCTNACLYCGFSCSNRIDRRRLSLDEIDAEGRAIAAAGMRHLLLLTGEAPELTPLPYLTDAVTILRRHVAAIGIEMFPMDTCDYAALCRAGVDSLTIYQETYDRDIYAAVHPRGRKADYDYRLGAPDRGAEAGFRALNIGALLGLADPRVEAFFIGLHAYDLETRYPDVGIGISLPRINAAEGGFAPSHPLDDLTFVQMLTAFRLFLPRADISLSTRERAAFRDRLTPLGVTRMSAGSCTGVGGYADAGERPGSQQFAITDTRSIAAVTEAIRRSGYQPVFKDWQALCTLE
ncbi:MAG: 2-iminoacetate synthase ThiH [Pseudomonadota bacterium]